MEGGRGGCEEGGRGGRDERRKEGKRLGKRGRVRVLKPAHLCVCVCVCECVWVCVHVIVCEAVHHRLGNGIEEG